MTLPDKSRPSARNVARLKTGDQVYGDLSESGFGAFAEYVCAPEGAVALKPHNLTYDQAAAIPHAGMLAQQALTQIGRVDRVRTLLINGAGGGVGALSVQLAKLHGVEVTGVDSTAKQDFLRSLGFDHVVDYTREDFTRTGRTYDLILDVKTNRSPFAYARSLVPNGTYVTVGGSTPRLLQCLAFGRWIARTRNRNIPDPRSQAQQGDRHHDPARGSGQNDARDRCGLPVERGSRRSQTLRSSEPQRKDHHQDELDPAPCRHAVNVWVSNSQFSRCIEFRSLGQS